MSVVGLPHRTNNGVESFYRQLNDTVGRHPSFWDFLGILWMNSFTLSATVSLVLTWGPRLCIAGSEEIEELQKKPQTILVVYFKYLLSLPLNLYQKNKVKIVRT